MLDGFIAHNAGHQPIVDSTVGAEAIPETVRALSSLPDIDYGDMFTITTAATTTPEQWARTMFGDLPDLGERVIWRGFLGLRLGREISPETVAGWRIGGRGDNWIRLEAASWFLSCNLIVRVTGRQMTLATFLRYDRRLGRLVWPTLSTIHRRLAPGLLRDAEAALAGAADRGSRPQWRLPNTAHTSKPWRIHEVAPDFRVHDVWALPTPGGPDDFGRLVHNTAAGPLSNNPSRLARALFDIRWKLGELLGWDDPDSGLGSRVPTLRDRLPADLRDGPIGPEFDSLPFRSVFLTGNEWAAELANSTVHGVLHLTWVRDEAGGYRGQMAVLVKPNGLFGKVYMAGIAPFRHRFVYPPLLRGIAQQWEADVRDESRSESPATT